MDILQNINQMTDDSLSVFTNDCWLYYKIKKNRQLYMCTKHHFDGMFEVFVKDHQSLLMRK